MSVNKVILIGRLGNKPELVFTPNGTPVSEFRLATDNIVSNGPPTTEWHRIKVWGKSAENVAQYLDKGRQVYIEGRIQTRSWDDKNTGEKRYMTEIVASMVRFLGNKPSSSKQDENIPLPGGSYPDQTEDIDESILT